MLEYDVWRLNTGVGLYPYRYFARVSVCNDKRTFALLRERPAKAERNRLGEAGAMAQRLFIPGPVTCAPSVLEAMAAPLVDHRGPEFAAVLKRITLGMKPVFGTTGDVVILGSSGTGGLEAALVNSFSAGQKLLACPVGLFGRRFANIAAQYGFDVEILETPLGERVDAQRLRQRLRQDRDCEFAGVLLTHNETSTGVQNDMAALSDAVGEHPATVIVDSVSGLGASRFAMDEWRFDIVVGASQKALGAAPGIALLACGKRAWERMAAARAPRFYFDLLRARELGAAGQTAWTPPVSIAFGLDAALALYAAEGAENAYARHARYARAIRVFAQSAGLATVSQPEAHSVTVVALYPPAGIDAAGLRRDLSDRYDIVVGGGQDNLKGKILRIGTMGDLSATDVLDALDAMAAALHVRGYSIDVAAAHEAARTVLFQMSVRGTA